MQAEFSAKHCLEPPPTLPRTLSSADVEDFRARLCDAAEHMFAERGPAAVTMRELAAAVGVSPMTPYRYFKDKDAILAAVRARAFDRHADHLEAAYAAHAHDPATRPLALAQAYIQFALDHPEAYKLMFDVHQPSAGSYPDLVRAGERSRRTMSLQLEESPGEATPVPKAEADLIAHMYWAALHGPLMLQMSGMLPPTITAPALIGALISNLDKALRGRARPAP
jgi:AcrR family transcriptional regulator